MQDRYVGDIGDFGKYALLRALCGPSDSENLLRLGIVWCLFPNETHSADGRHVSYLTRGHMRPLDVGLHDCLQRIVSAKNRKVSAIASSGLFPPSTVFFDRPTSQPTHDGRPFSPTQRVAYREAWFRECLKATDACDVMFLDPDNGVEMPSVTKRHLKAGKYIFWDELTRFARRGQSLVVYHHTNRRAPVRKQIHDLLPLFHQRLSPSGPVIPMIFRRGSCRVFWLVLREPSAGLLQDRVREMMRSGWHHHFEIG